jgi:hypothetical protein
MNILYRMKGLKNLVKWVDLFSAPIVMKYKGRSHYQSLFGGLMTLLVGLLTGGLLLVLFKDYLLGKVFTRSVDIQYRRWEHAVNFSSFFFMTGMLSDSYSLGPGRLRIYGQEIKGLAPCELSRLQGWMPGLTFEVFQEKGLHKWLCSPPFADMLQVSQAMPEILTLDLSVKQEEHSTLGYGEVGFYFSNLEERVL